VGKRGGTIEVARAGFRFLSPIRDTQIKDRAKGITSRNSGTN
jgi:hypothetical protein